MNPRARKSIWVVAVILAVAVGVWVVLETQSERVAGTLSDLVTAKFGGQRNIRIEMADIDGSILGNVRIKDLRIIYTGGEAPRVLLAASDVYAQYDLLSFFRGTVRIDSIYVVSPRLVVPVGPDGRRIYPQGDAVASEGPGRDVEIRAIKVDDLSAVWEAREPLMVKGASVGASYSKSGAVSNVDVRGSGLGYGASARIDTLSAHIRSLPDRTEITGAEVHTPGSALAVTGVFGVGSNDSLTLEARLDSLAVGEIPVFLGRPVGSLTGKLVGDVRLSGRYTDLRLEALLAGTVDAVALDSLRFAGAFAESTLDVVVLSCRVNGSPVEVAGTIRFSTPPEYSATAHFAGLDLSKLVPADTAGYVTDLTGEVRVVGHGFERQDLAVTAWPELVAGTYGDWTFDTVRGRVGITPEGVRMDTLFAGIADTRLVTSGSVSFAGDTRLDFQLDCPRLSDLEAYHKLKDLKGEVTASGSLSVETGQVGLSIKSLGRGIDYSGAYLESLLVDVSLDQPGGRWAGRGGLLATSVDLRGFKAGKLVCDATVEDSTVSIERLDVTRPDGQLLGASGEVEILPGALRATINDLFVEVAEYVWKNRMPVVLTYGGDSLSLSGFDLWSEMGTVSVADSRFARDGYSFETQVEGLDLGLLKRVLGKDIPTGLLDLGFRASGDPEDLAFDLDFTLKNGELRTVGFTSLDGAISYRDKTLQLDHILLDQNGGNVTVDGAVPVDLSPRRLGELSGSNSLDEVLENLGEISVRATNMDISIFRPLAPPLAKIEGIVEMEMALGGSRRDPVIASSGTLRQVVYGETPVGGLAWDVLLRDSLLTIKSLEVTGQGEKVRVAGDMPVALSLLPFSVALPRKPINMQVQAENGDLGLLCEIVPRLKVCSGTYGADLKIGGPLDDPTFNGRIKLVGAGLRFEGVPQDLQGINLTVDAQGKRFTVTDVTAEGGALKARGRLDLEGVRVSDYDFALTMKNLAVTEFEDFYAVLSGNVTVKAEPIEYVGVVPRIEGNVTVEEGEYYYSTEQMAAGGGGGMGPEAAPTWLMNVGVEIPNDFWVRGNDIDAELQGSVNVKRGPEGLLALGTLRTVRGTFSIYNNEFRITRGEFRFTDVKSITNVYIDLEATSRVLDEKVDIAAKGNMDNLEVTATSESGWSETQIFEALTLRRGTQTEGEPKGKFFTTEFLRSWGLTLVNRFGDEVARELRLDQFGVEIGNVGDGGVLSATRVTFGKYVSDKVYLQYTQSLGAIYGGTGKLSQRGLTFPERQFQVEYRLSDRFSMEGEAGTVGGLGYFDVDIKYSVGY